MVFPRSPPLPPSPPELLPPPGPPPLVYDPTAILRDVGDYGLRETCPDGQEKLGMEYDLTHATETVNNLGGFPGGMTQTTCTAPPPHGINCGPNGDGYFPCGCACQCTNMNSGQAQAQELRYEVRREIVEAKARERGRIVCRRPRGWPDCRSGRGHVLRWNGRGHTVRRGRDQRDRVPAV